MLKWNQRKRITTPQNTVFKKDTDIDIDTYVHSSFHLAPPSVKNRESNFQLRLPLHFLVIICPLNLIDYSVQYIMVDAKPE